MVMSTFSAAANSMTNTSQVLSPHLRGYFQFPSRYLRPHHRSGHHSTYQGCLAYSDSELNWHFPGQAPSCSWVHSGDSSGSSSSGGSSGGSSTGSNGGGYGDDDSNGNGYWTNNDDIEYSGEQDYDSVVENGNSGNGDGNSDGNSSGGDDDSQITYTDDDEVVVSNEDVSSGNSEYDPMDDFDIEMCNTYENLWLWDLSLSCDMTGGDLTLNECNCTFAEELLENEYLSCDDVALCPDDCLICFTCLKLLGCDVDPKLPRISQSVSTSVMLYVVAAAVALLIFALAAYYARRKWQDDHNLNINLIEKQKHRIIDIEDGPSFMYINGDLTWKPLPSDQQYAAEQIQPVCTMSTASTGKYLEERVQPSNANSASEEEKDSFSDHENSLEGLVVPSSNHEKVPSVVETMNAIENSVLSSIQTAENSSDEEHFVFEDALQSPISIDNDKQKFSDE
eukprot:jgi/Psemu1/247185/estExt_Genewise1.C_9800001